MGGTHVLKVCVVPLTPLRGRPFRRTPRRPREGDRGTVTPRSNQLQPGGTAFDTILKVVSILAPAGAGITALAFWFGWALTNARSEYFGIDASVLGYTTTDYVLRSADVMLVPVISVLLLFMLGLGLHLAFMGASKSEGGKRLVRVAAWALMAVGGVATSLGVVSLFVRVPIIQDNFLFPPSLTGGGPIAFAYAIWLRSKVPRLHLSGPRANEVPRWQRILFATVAGLGVVCLFWATSRFAAGLGIDRARSLVENLSSRPITTIYSTTDLSLPEPVRATALKNTDTFYRFRYSGLRLITRSNGQYFLLTEGWTRTAGIAIILQESPNIRYEFRPGRPTS